MVNSTEIYDRPVATLGGSSDRRTRKYGSIKSLARVTTTNTIVLFPPKERPKMQ